MKAILLTRTGDPSVLEYARCRHAAAATGRGAGQGRHHRREPAGDPGAPGRLCLDAAAAGDSGDRAGRHGGASSARASPRFEVGRQGLCHRRGSWPGARRLLMRSTSRWCRSGRRSCCRVRRTWRPRPACPNYQVAWHLLHHRGATGVRGQSVLIGSASGGLGSARGSNWPSSRAWRRLRWSAPADKACAWPNTAPITSSTTKPRTSPPASPPSPATSASISCSTRSAAMASRNISPCWRRSALAVSSPASSLVL